ncbi:hypothetical protein CSIRO_0747 [Bradyrhizobiaceae bacterium SG-6C]|nr:hypothetical protein CSIRO_0747 [Bradyrhizobiaceae bacterium SG-6C]
MSTYAAETAALSKDGRLFALAVKTGEKKIGLSCGVLLMVS